MEGPFIHIGAMVAVQVSRLFTYLTGRFPSLGMDMYGKILAGVVEQRMFICSGAVSELFLLLLVVVEA